MSEPHVTTKPGDTHAAVDRLFERFRRSDAPGMVVGVAQHGRSIYRTGVGMASVQHGVANTAATRMRIGSTSKHFACLAAMLLQEAGKLDVDAPASRYVDELDLPRNREDMPTLRQFMWHTSGRHCGLDLLTMANGTASMPRGALVQAMARQHGRSFVPGQGQLYNNGGYHLLSVAIARASGQPFEQFMRERIFEPLGMTETECVPDFVRLVPRMASLHVPDPAGGWRLGLMPVEDLLGEGSIVSTVDDMLRWLAHLRSPQKIVGSEQTWRQMLTPATLAGGRRSTYGLGLFRHHYRGLEVIHHGGNVTGGNSQMLTVPAHELDIVIMNNGQPVSTKQLTRDIVDTLLAEACTGPADPLARAERYAHLAGARYHSDSGVTLAFDALPDGTLGLALWHMPALPLLFERPDGRLSAEFEDIAAGPIELQARDLEPGPDGAAPATLRVADMGRLHTLARLPDPPPAAGELAAAFVGRYHSADFAAEAEIRLEGKGLHLRVRGEYSGWQTQPLEALSPTVLALAGGPVFSFPGTPGDRVDRFFVDSLRARRVEFVRMERS